MHQALPVLALILACGWSVPSYAHGKERRFGTSINGRSSTRETAESHGSPEFTLLALSANLNALERELGEGRGAEVRERARRLPGMARELVARLRHLGAIEREQVHLAARSIMERAEHIDSAAADLEAEGILREVHLVRERIESLEDLLRNSKD